MYRSRALALVKNERARAWAVFVAILAVLSSEKVPFTRHSFSPQPDGGYYMNIAQHIRDGDGFVSNICLAMQGCPYLPHPTAIYPLWPYLYGYVSRVTPLWQTGRWLPTLLYYAALLFGYLWGASLVRRPLFPAVFPSLNPGHVLAIMFGMNHEFFRYTSMPYTDGLTYAILLLALWRFTSLWPKPSIRSGVEMGILLALAMLARKQMFLMAVSASAVLIGAVVFLKEHRKQYVAMAVSCFVAFCATLTPHYFQLRSFVPHFKLGMMLRWDEARYTEALTPLRMLRHVPGFWNYVKDRASGIPIAFGTGPASYTAQYYWFQYALIPATALLLVLALKHHARSDIAAGWRWLLRPESLSYVYVVLFALAGFLSIHTVHMHREASGEWWFSARQALTTTFIFFLALTLLFMQPHAWWRASGLVILGVSIYLGGKTIRDLEKSVELLEEPPPPALALWLNEEKAARGELTLAFRQPQMLAQYTPGVNYHWYHDYTKYEDIKAMVTVLGANYVAVLVHRPAAFFHDPRFNETFTLVTGIGLEAIYAPDKALRDERSAVQGR